jgi:hypothetical protein
MGRERGEAFAIRSLPKESPARARMGEASVSQRKLVRGENTGWHSLVIDFMNCPKLSELSVGR